MRRLLASAAVAVAAVLLEPLLAHAGGAGENVVLLVDPGSSDARIVAGRYAALREIPAANVLAMSPGAVDYQELAAWQLPALLDTLEARGIADHVDYVVLPSGSPYFVSAPGLVSPGQCPAPFSRIALPSAYTLAFMAPEILAGGMTVEAPNQYFSNQNAPRAFDSRTRWSGGQPATTPGSGTRYLIGVSLGYSGEQGNTAAETVAMIERSVAADHTFPDGTFYMMSTEDPARSGPRELPFLSARSALQNLGAKAEILDAVLPVGRHDALGVMTGDAAPPIETAEFTLVPGAWGDHLTSYAATFDTGQAKVSSWIRKGASGSLGAVEEPCNYPGKFPHPRLFVWYWQGMSLGESLFRSLGYAPFHGMPYGDPLTQPFAKPPALEVQLDWPGDGSPPAIVSGTLDVPFSATKAGGEVLSVEAFVDGVRAASLELGEESAAAALSIDTNPLDDGDHRLLVISTEASDVRAQATWARSFRVDNRGRYPNVTATAYQGDPRAYWHFDVQAHAATEIRVLEAMRVAGAGSGDAVSIDVQRDPFNYDPEAPNWAVVAEYPDGSHSVWRMGPYDDLLPGPISQGLAPSAYSYHADVLPAKTQVLDLPVTGTGSGVVAEILTPPGTGAVHQSGATTFFRAAPGASGTDQVVFRARRGDEISAPATVTLRYCDPPTIVEQPTSVELCVGRSGLLDVTATGTRLTYEWSHDGERIEGANGPTLNVSGDAGSAGDYMVTVRSWCGGIANSVASQPAHVSVVERGAACLSQVWLPVAER